MKIYKSELDHKKRIHLIGVGGISMSAIAAILHNDGHKVTGSDSREGEQVISLRERGIHVNVGHNLENVEDADLIIYTNAVPFTDPELALAKKLGKKIVERAEFMSQLTKKYDECVGISGTHGKTTTTSMISLCFIEGQKDPSVQVGAYLENIKSNYLIGDSEYLIIESCEYKDSFLKFYPDCAVVLNIDLDHVDYFKNIDMMKKSFLTFMKKVPKGGKIIVNGDDANILDLLNNNSFEPKITTFGKSKTNDYYFDNIRVERTSDHTEITTYDIYEYGKFLGEIKLQLVGEHNVLDSVAAIAVSRQYKIELEDIQKALFRFKGAHRRFEYKGKINGARVFDDYAHHPNEIASISESLNNLEKNESYAIFEGHTYSRILNFLDKFVDNLMPFDNIIIAPIYAAREQNTTGLTVADIVKKFKEKDPNKNVVGFESYDEIKKYIIANAKEGDVIFTLGAGVVTNLSNDLVECGEKA